MTDKPRGADVYYTRTGSDGSKISVSMHGATPEQVALVAWLRAEDEWNRNKEWRLRENKRKREEERRQQELIDSNNRLLRKFEELLSDPETTGFRREMIMRHRPAHTRGYHGSLLCHTCMSTDYEPDYLSWPCDEYVFVRDWKPEPT